jgi:hypothetical protein
MIHSVIVVSAPQLIFIAFEVFSAGHVTMEKRPFGCAVRVKDAAIASIEATRLRLMAILKFIIKRLSV